MCVCVCVGGGGVIMFESGWVYFKCISQCIGLEINLRSSGFLSEDF